MSEIVQIIDSLEQKIGLLLNKISRLEEENTILRKELQNGTSLVREYLDSIEKLKKENETLKISSSFAGSENYKRDTKLKINSLIREIDYCIAQLSE